MSIVITQKDGWIISHLDFTKKVYKNLKNEKFTENELKFEFFEKFFKINCQFIRDNQLSKATNGILEEEAENPRKRKRKKKTEIDEESKNEIKFVKSKFNAILTEEIRAEFFKKPEIVDNNKEARSVAQEFFKNSYNKIYDFSGENSTEENVIEEIEGEKFVFPRKSSFCCCDVRKVDEKLKEDGEFDFILMDPPWWNKFVRRKREKSEESGYKMMYNEDLTTIPIKNLLKPSGIVAVWCSASKIHQSDVRTKIFPDWGVKPIATWYWVKVTESGYPVCNFRLESVKQPYELIIFGVKSGNCDAKIPDGKIIVSIPSSVHSHKPPLTEVIQQFFPGNPRCLELFARYLLPNWTSCGFEALKFQHLWVYS